jgi:hypothetical protein
MDGIGAAKLSPKECCSWQEKGLRREERTYRSAPLFQAHDEKEARRLLEGGLAAAGLSTRELDSLPGSDVRKVRLGKFDLGANGSEAELDCRQTGDAQRCKRESTSPPVPCPEIQVASRFKRVSPVCKIC